MTGISDEAVERLERLDVLRRSGAITQEEFDAAKASVLRMQDTVEQDESFVSVPSPPRPFQTGYSPKVAPPISQSLKEVTSKFLSLDNRTVAWFTCGAVLGVVFLAILLIPFSGERGAACSGAIVQVFESKPSYDYSKGPPDLSKVTSNYRFCRNEAMTRVGVGATGLVITGLIAGGGYLATRPRKEESGPVG